MKKIKDDDKKSLERLEVRLTKDQMRMLDEFAERLGLSRSSAVKYLIKAAEGWGTTTPTPGRSLIIDHE